MCNYYDQSLNELQFYFSSADKKPTKGTGEKFVAEFQGMEFLSKFVDWRKVLSNFHVTEKPMLFTVNEVTGEAYHFRTVEHIYQAMKYFVNGYNSIGMKFTLESGDAIGQGVGLDARKGRKLVNLSPKELDNWFKKSKSVMNRALEIKFSTDRISKLVLDNTFPCKLFHIIPRKPREHWVNLELIRNKKIFDDVVEATSKKEGVTYKQARELIANKITNIDKIVGW